jgi:hypothetical protein
MRNRPSSHLLFLLGLLLVNLVAYAAIFRSGVLRGFTPSVLLAVRDLLLLIPIGACLVWLIKRRRYAGDLTLFSVAILLFSVGQVVQYRLFTDPEYSTQQKSAARLAKTNTLRQRYINQYYDAEKKRALFGDPNFKIPLDTTRASDETYWTLGQTVTSISTWIPIVALLGLCVSFSLVRRDDVLLLLQRYSFVLGLLTAIPFALIAIYYSSGGKFLGKTTPWEPVKISFLLSYAGVLADQYRNLSRTRWGLPPLRYLLPFLFIALLPLVPFFALSDFGQMLVFCGAFLTLYVVAVRRLPQVVIAGFVLATLLISVILASGLVRSFGAESQASFIQRLEDVPSRGVPRRIHNASTFG